MILSARSMVMPWYSPALVLDITSRDTCEGSTANRFANSAWLTSAAIP
jgi:hypothetical protein